MESDAIGLRFSAGFTTLGSDEDASKLYNLDENYAISNNGYKSIDKQELPTHGHVIELFTANYTTTNYSLNFTLGNQPQELAVYLHDTYLNTQTELLINTVYNYTVDNSIPASIAIDRFSLHFTDTTLEIGDSSFSNSLRLYPNPVNGDEVTISMGTSSDASVNVAIYNTLGQKIMSRSFAPVNNSITIDNLSNLSNGMYFVNLTSGDQQATLKVIKE
jgi:hypothetical protein